MFFLQECNVTAVREIEIRGEDYRKGLAGVLEALQKERRHPEYKEAG